MRGISKVLIVVGIVLVAYAVFSRFYGMPSVAMMRFKSVSFLILANTTFLLSIILNSYANK
jgi:hypothetical protein